MVRVVCTVHGQVKEEAQRKWKWMGRDGMITASVRGSVAKGTETRYLVGSMYKCANDRAIEGIRRLDSPPTL